MARVVLVVGDTGTGKSTAIKTLDPKESFIFNTLSKDLPFKGYKALYNKENKNIATTQDHKSIISTLKAIPINLPHVKNIVLDDVGFASTKEFFDRVLEKGYEKFTEIGLHMQQIIETAKSLPDGITVFLMFHEDDQVSDKIRVGKKVKLIGAMLEDKYNPLAIVSVCLFTNVSFDGEKPKYSFITNRTNLSGQIIPAKSPEGMFTDLYIPNDLNLVINQINEYYQ